MSAASVDDAVAEADKRVPQTPHARQALIQYWALWGLASLAVLALIVKVALSTQNTGLERDIVEKQRFVSQTVPISRLNVQLVQDIANAAARTGDPALEKLLARQGIQFEIKNAQ